MTTAELRKRQIRKKIINLATRHQRPGSGSATAFLKERTAMVKYPDLSRILETVPWAVIGAVATRLYMPERLTQDLDIIIRDKDAFEVRNRLERVDFKYHSELAIGGSSWLSAEGSNLDVVESSEGWLDQALKEAQNNRDWQGLPILPLPYLVLLKFKSGRLQDLADISRMLGQASEEMLNSVRQVFVHYLPNETEDLESLITLGQLEMKG